MRVIFLNIDGVINRSTTNHHVTPTQTEPLPIPIEPACMRCLNRLITETNSKVVISSSWRKFARWQDLGPALERHGLVAKVIGETPDLSKNKTWLANWQMHKGVPFNFARGWEIAEWLAAHPEVTAFVILDDVADMATLIPWLVRTRPNEGLTDLDVERAKYLLDRSAVGIERAIETTLGFAEETSCG